MTTVSAQVASLSPDTPPEGAAVSGQVLAALGLLSLGALPPILLLPHDRLVADASLPLLGWLPLGIAGVVFVDRAPRAPVGWAAVVVSALTPLAMLLATGSVGSAAAPARGVAAGPLWLLPLLAVAAAALPASARSARRWRTWIAVWCGVAVGGGALAWEWGSVTTFGLVATLGLLAVAGAVSAAALVREPRPVAEPLVDAGLLVGVLASGVAAGWVMWTFAEHERVFGAEVVGALAAGVTIMMATPAAVTLRRSWVARRYGSGILSPDDLTMLSVDLGGTGDPRALLATAGELVAVASGTDAVEIVLDEAEPRPGWTSFPLVVGEEVVGAMSVRPRHPEGLEARQYFVVRQLAPTVALAARAVELAVAAEHARSDVIRQREAERVRILADLHDDLGPALAGMGMRVEAARSAGAAVDLTALAADLAACRADLRRIVSALTPEPLVGADLGRALATLVDSFATEAAPVITLETATATDVDGTTAIVAYRVVAEALTNALRHSGSTRVEVSVAYEGGVLQAEVRDDGRGAPVVPGVGLTSMAQRAREVGGRLDVVPGADSGLVVRLVVPGAPA